MLKNGYLSFRKELFTKGNWVNSTCRYAHLCRYYSHPFTKKCDSLQGSLETKKEELTLKKPHSINQAGLRVWLQITHMFDFILMNLKDVFYYLFCDDFEENLQ